MSEVQDKKPAGKKAASKKPAAKPVGAFDGLADMMNAGDLGGLTDNSGQNFSMVAIAEILVKAQVREVFEDAETALKTWPTASESMAFLSRSLFARFPVNCPSSWWPVSGACALR